MTQGEEAGDDDGGPEGEAQQAGRKREAEDVGHAADQRTDLGIYYS